MSIPLKISWFWTTTTFSVSIFITIIYWSFLSGDGHFSALANFDNIAVHALQVREKKSQLTFKCRQCELKHLFLQHLDVDCCHRCPCQQPTYPTSSLLDVVDMWLHLPYLQYHLRRRPRVSSGLSYAWLASKSWYDTFQDSLESVLKLAKKPILGASVGFCFATAAAVIVIHFILFGMTYLRDLLWTKLYP